MKPKISLITLAVADLQRSLAFYRDGLGLPTHNYQEDQGIVFFEMDGTWLALYPKDKLAEDLARPGANFEFSGAQGGFSPVTLAHNVKTKEEVDAVIQQAIDAGAKLIKPAEDAFWGGYSGYFTDPDNHLWEIAHNPFMDLT